MNIYIFTSKSSARFFVISGISIASKDVTVRSADEKLLRISTIKNSLLIILTTLSTTSTRIFTTRDNETYWLLFLFSMPKIFCKLSTWADLTLKFHQKKSKEKLLEGVFFKVRWTRIRLQAGEANLAWGPSRCYPLISSLIITRRIFGGERKVIIMAHSSRIMKRKENFQFIETLFWFFMVRRKISSLKHKPGGRLSSASFAFEVLAS